MRRHVRECAAPAVRGVPATAAWNRASHECGSGGRESPPPLPPDRTKIRAPPHPPRPPSPPLTPTHFFRNAACSAAFSADAVSPPTETAQTRTKPSRCSTLRLGMKCAHHLRSPPQIPASEKLQSPQTIFRHVPRLKVMPLGNHYFGYERTLSVGTCTAMLTTSWFTRAGAVHEEQVREEQL